MSRPTHPPVHRGALARIRGSALVLTLFTVAILLVLGTSYIAMSASERRATRGDKNATLGRQAANFGVNWAIAFMGHQSHWSSPTANPNTGSIGYTLQLANAAEQEWMGIKFAFAPVPYSAAVAPEGVTSGGYRLTLQPQANLLWNVVTNGNLETVSAHLEVTIWPYNGIANGRPSPQQYIIHSLARLYRGNLAGANGAVGSVPANVEPIFRREVYAKVREASALDYSVFLANARTWDAANLNSAEFSSDTPPSPTPGPKPPDSAGPDAMAAWANEYNARLSRYNAWKASVRAAYGAIGIPKDYTSDGNIRIDGAVNGTNAWKGSVSTTLPDGSQGGTVDGSLRFFDTTGVQLNGDITRNANRSHEFASGQNPYDSSGNPQAGVYNPFKHGNLAAPARGLPQAGNLAYMDVVGADGAKSADGFAAQLTQSTSAAGQSGYIKVSTPPQGAVGVTPGAGGSGAAVEYDATGANKQPGFAKIQVTFDSVNHPNQVLIEQRGAYSGGLVPGNGNSVVGSTGSSGWVNVDNIKNGMIYVDGGNVEVRGSVNKSITLVASASTERPTVTNQPNEPPKRIDYGAPGVATSLNKSIYRAPDDPIFATGNVPAYDAATNKVYWPAWDPTKANPDSNNPVLKNMDPYSKSALVREGNISITGDLTKTGTNASSVAVGLVAQNNIILNDQSGSSTLKVHATLMSTQRSVQYAGLLPQSNPGGDAASRIKDYYATLGYPNIPARRAISNGTFELKGSIIGQYADVESTQTGQGYTVQKVASDRNAQSNPPPGFPQFSRTTNANEPVYWVIVMTTDNSAITTQ